MPGCMVKPYDGMQLSKIVTRAVAQKHGISTIEIKSARQSKKIVTARNEAIYRIFCKTTFSLPLIGRLFNRDHTTIIHSLRRHKASM
jgi:chromosomal replication initiator protein